MVKHFGPLDRPDCQKIEILQIPDGGGRHLENLNIVAVWAISTKFGMMMQLDPFNRSDRWKFEISKIQDGGGRHLEKSKNRHISAAIQPIFT